MAQLSRVLRSFLPVRQVPDQVAGLPWNRSLDCRGMGGRFRVELVAGLPWKTQLWPCGVDGCFQALQQTRAIWQSRQRIVIRQTGNGGLRRTMLRGRAQIGYAVRQIAEASDRL